MDKTALARYNMDEASLERLSESYQSGWLHNVLSRITPLTMRRRDDYLAMADIFIDSADAAENVLDRFDADLELFCSMADIMVTKHMSANNVSDELKCHVSLYNDVSELFHNKWKIDKRNPIEVLTESPMMTEASNPFIKDYMDKMFERENS